MTFYAIDKKTGLEVDARKSIFVYRPGDIRCILCKQDLMPKYSTIISNHFAHLPEASFCSLMSDYTSESALHKIAKAYMAELLSVESFTSLEFSFGFGNPRTDILADYTKVKVAHEIQLSYISSFDLKTRAFDLKECGAGQNWWLGGHAATPWNKRIIQKFTGFTSYLETGNNDLPQPIAEKVVFDGDTPYIARMDYPIIRQEPLQSAKYYKFIGKNGNFSLWKIVDISGNLVQLQDVFKDDHKIWTYLDQPYALSIYGKAIRSTIHNITRR